MTSANVTYYEVWEGDKFDKFIGEECQNCMCKYTVRERLAKYQPAEKYTLRLRWPDEEEEEHYSESINLKAFMDGGKVEWIRSDGINAE